MKKQLLIALILTVSQGFAQFVQKPLEYSYSALEPYIDGQTMEIHYNKHHAAYVKNLNAALAGTPTEKMTIMAIFDQVSKVSPVIRNNAGGHFNHEFFWTLLSPKLNTQPSTELTKAITEEFGSLDALKTKINTAAIDRFGSGWVWLIVTKEGKLAITSTPNQDNPLMDIAELRGMPIIGIDVWEHAYYLKYQNKRSDYLGAVWNVINWEKVSEYYKTATTPKKGKFDDWPALKNFHKVMSQTFHPAEEGNLAPIKERSGEMVQRAKELNQSVIPDVFRTKEVKAAVQKLERNSLQLDAMIASKKSDAEITAFLTQLHDTFHEIIGLCSNEEHH